MKIRAPKEKLQTAVQKVSNTITQKNTLPILSNILIEAKNNKIHMVGTDLEITTSHTVPTEVLEEGGITMPAKKIGDIIKELPNNDVVISTQKNNNVVITCEKAFFKIMGLPKEDFPELPKTETKDPLTMKQNTLKTLLNRTSFAVSKDETRYVLSGILFVLKDNQLRLVATDGRRLALVQKQISNPGKVKKEAIIPSKTISELNRALKEEGEVTMFFNQNQIVFKLEDTVIVSRLIDGHFPAYEQIIPSVVEQKLGVKREDFLGAIKRTGLLASPNSRIVRLELFRDKVLASNQAPEIGEAREELAAFYKGKQMVVGFNPGYLIDVLKRIEQDEVVLELAGPEKPGVIRVGDEYLYVLMPMQLS
ncbi:MAG: DNA polymerase III subunit beta [Candidatus Omnitrophota bacterium]|nr:DNA polymerase III subunit beta [Candidatus Omnitrophota bacterium]